MPSTVRRFVQDQLGVRDGVRALRTRARVRVDPAVQVSATVFLILRRMRAPLITLIIIFTVSVFGLTLIPGQDSDGQPYRMGFFDAFYFMSYTATTIGFGRQLVIIDASESQIEALDMDTFQVDIPALAGDARSPHHLAAAGLHHPLCEGVLAMTDDDEVNLAVAIRSLSGCAHSAPRPWSTRSTASATTCGLRSAPRTTHWPSTGGPGRGRRAPRRGPQAGLRRHWPLI